MEKFRPNGNQMSYAGVLSSTVLCGVNQLSFELAGSRNQILTNCESRSGYFVLSWKEPGAKPVNLECQTIRVAHAGGRAEALLELLRGHALDT